MRGEPPRTRSAARDAAAARAAPRPRDREGSLGKHQGDPGCYNTPEDCVSFGGGRKSRELDSTMLLTDSAAVEEPAEENQGLFDSVFSFFK